LFRVVFFLWLGAKSKELQLLSRARLAVVQFVNRRVVPEVTFPSAILFQAQGVPPAQSFAGSTLALLERAVHHDLANCSCVVAQ
jgi:hypothetical protein